VAFASKVLAKSRSAMSSSVILWKKRRPNYEARIMGWDGDRAGRAEAIVAPLP
jgi:hypothetical protein